MNNNQKLVYSAFLLAIGVILPIFFHFISLTGPIFLPMHLPVILGGMLLGAKRGAFLGVLTPMLSSFFTGMPVIIPMLPIMMVELGLYGFSAGYLYQKKEYSIITSLLGTMVIGRLGVAGLLFFMADSLGITLSPLAFIVASFIKGLPGVILQLIAIPLVFRPIRVLMHDN